MSEYHSVPTHLAQNVDSTIAVQRATTELQKRGLAVDRYNISVHRERDLLTVLFESRDKPENTLGSGGSAPSFAVEFDPQTMALKKSYFVR